MLRIWYLAGAFLALTLAADLGNAQAIVSNDLPDDPATQAPAFLQQNSQQPQPATTPAAQSGQTATTPAQPQTSPSQNQSQTQTQTQSQTQPQSPSSTTAPQAADPKAPKTETSADQLHAEEKQRILGVMATFNTTNNREALPLTPAQKFQLFFKSTTDPWAFFVVGVSAGVGQAENSPPEWHGGMAGYSRRFAAGYADSFDGNLWGNAILTSWWHEDPRYYRMGKGNIWKRGFWAASSSFWCKRDNGTWGPNYANVIGNLIGGTIANAYYPPSQQGIDATLDHTASVTAYGILGAEIIEFMPDIEHHFIEKHREKLARKAAQEDAKQEKQQQQQAAPATQ